MIDGHAHPIPGQPTGWDPGGISLDVTTGPDAHARRTRWAATRLSTELLVTRLAAHLGCPPGDLPQARAAAATDWAGYVSGLIADAGITALIMDGAGPLDAAAQSRLCGVPVHELARVEPLLDELIGNGATLRELREALASFVTAAAARGAVGLKTVLAYRTGLAVNPHVTVREAEVSLHGDAPVRRRGKAARDLLFADLLDLAATHALPIQVHTGYGDSDLRLSASNPLLLEDTLATPAGRAATLVLLHGSFPWHDQAAYLASVTPNLYLDVSLSPIFSPATTAGRLLAILDTAPAGKVMLGTDGHGQPETHWFAAHTLSQALDQVRTALSNQGARAAWVTRAVEAITQGNAQDVYHLPG